MTDIFPPHKAGASLEHNEHKNIYETVEQYIRSTSVDDDEWATPTSRAQAIKTNELWVMRWYPETPVGFCAIYGATLDEVLKAPKENIRP
jgi:predicted alpha/beta hydrolase